MSLLYNGLCFCTNIGINYLAGPNFQVQRNRYDAPIAQRSNAYLVRIIVMNKKYRKICEMAIGTCEDKHLLCSLSNQLNIVYTNK
jgi:hypothetical protein